MRRPVNTYKEGGRVNNKKNKKARLHTTGGKEVKKRERLQNERKHQNKKKSRRTKDCERTYKTEETKKEKRKKIRENEMYEWSISVKKKHTNEGTKQEKRKRKEDKEMKTEKDKLNERNPKIKTIYHE